MGITCEITGYRRNRTKHVGYRAKRVGCGYATGVAAWPSQAPNRRLLPMRRNTRSGRFSTLLIGWNLPQRIEYSPSAAILPMGLILSETLRRGRPSAGTPPSTMPGTEPRPTPFVLSPSHARRVVSVCGAGPPPGHPRRPGGGRRWRRRCR